MNKAFGRAALTLLAITLAGCSTRQGGTAITAADITAPSPVVQSTVQSVPGIGTDPAATTPAPAPSSSARVSTSVLTVTVTSTSPPTSRPTTTTSAAPSTNAGPTTKTSAQSTAFPVCPAVQSSDAAGIVTCLRRSVSDFWSGELNQVIDQPVIVNPAAGQVPADCRGGLTAAPAFTCQVNDTVYINQSLITLVTTEFGAKDVPYALASVVSHEIGHVVQAAVQQPGYNRTGTSDTLSQRIEQQADCLSGVWAHAMSGKNKMDGAVFVSVADALITDISSNPEIATHGTPDQRAAAIAVGMRNGRPQDCSLATFS